MTAITKQEFNLANYYTVACEFTPGGRSYTYLCNIRDNENVASVAIGDRVLVSVKGELKIITVVGLFPPTPKADVIEYKWIIGKVIGNYEAVKNIRLVEG